MAHVLCLQPEEARSALERALVRPRGSRGGVRHRVEFITAWSGLGRRCRTLRDPVLVAVIDPYTPSSSTEPGGLQRRAFRQFRTGFPSVGVVACADFGAERVRDIVALVEIGVKEIVDWSGHEAATRLRGAVARVSPGTRDRLRDHLRARWGDTASWAVLDFLFVRSRPDLDVPGLARAHSTSPRSLERRLREDGLETPHRVIVLSLLYHASLLLADPGRPVEAVGRALGFSDCSAICKTCRRHLGMTPTELRAGLAPAAWRGLLERGEGRD